LSFTFGSVYVLPVCDDRAVARDSHCLD